MASSPPRIGLAISRNAVLWLSLIAFAAWGLFLGYWPQPGAQAHPQWMMAGFEQGPLSLAPHRTLEGLAQLLAAPLAFLTASLLTRDRGDKDFVGVCVAIGALGFAGYALVTRLPHLSEANTRLDVHFGSPNAAALTFAMLATLAAALSMRVVRRRIGAQGQRTNLAWSLAPVAFGALALCLAALLLTASRAGIPAGIGALVFFFLLLAAARPSRQSFSLLSIAPLALVAALAAIGGVYAWERLDALEPDAGLRADLLSTHWQLFLERPITGHGLNTFHELNQLTLTPENWRVMRTMGSTHNIFVQALEETGIVGLTLLSLAVASVIWRLIGAIFARDSGADWAACALAIIVLGLVHGLVDFGLQLPAIAALAATLAGAFSSPSERPG